MKLHKLRIEGFRRIKDATFRFADTTFLIGQNNAGKSSALEALNRLLDAAMGSLPDTDYYHTVTAEEGQCIGCDQVVITGEFRDLPPEASMWRGFKGRILPYDVPVGSGESGLGITIRKIFRRGEKASFEMLQGKLSLKPVFAAAKTIAELIGLGAPEEEVKIAAGATKTLTEKIKEKLLEIPELIDVDDTDKNWFANPGGIPQNIVTKLPTFVRIPLDDGRDEVRNKSGALHTIMNDLYGQVIERSKHYEEAQAALRSLNADLDPEDASTEFGRLMAEINGAMGGVFPETMFHATASLDDLQKVLNPSFTYEMSSNVKMPIPNQGSGMVRSAVFALLKFRQEWMQRNEGKSNGLIIGFEEPELYLHPNAANKMRDTIYELTGSTQIVCTTHSPFMVDLSRKPRQVLTSMSCNGDGTTAKPFSLSEVFLALQGDDKTQMKMLLKMDDYLARVFFAHRVVVVEGDTEDIVMRETIARMPDGVREQVQAYGQVIKARGKAVIISLVKYLRAFGLDVFVIHDRDEGEANAVKFNDPILAALDGDNARRIMLEECVEDCLGYEPPSNEKPYRAFLIAKEWGPAWADVPEKWRNIVEQAFAPFFDGRQ